MRFAPAFDRGPALRAPISAGCLRRARHLKKHTFMSWRKARNGDTLRLTVDHTQGGHTMTANQLTEIIARVEALERTLASLTEGHTGLRRRRAKRLTAVTAGVIAGLALALTAAAVSSGSHQGGGQRVVAPFTVLDKSGKSIATIGEAGAHRGLFVFGPCAQADAGCATVTIEGTGQQGVNVFDSSGSKQVAFLGVAKSDGGGLLRIHDSSGKLNAALSRDNEGTAGMLSLLRSSGTPIAVLGKAGVLVKDSGGQAVAQLGFAPTNAGAGYLAIGTASGALVEAGVLNGAFGVVRTYPTGGAPPIPIPNFIVGHGFAQQGQ
jgi:hypothetical protein